MLRRIATIALIWLLGACGGGPLRIERAALGTGYDAERAALSGERTVFKPADNPIYCLVTLAGDPGGTAVRFEWVVVDAGGENNYAYQTDTVTTAAGKPLAVGRLALPGAFPAGRYRVDIALNGVPSQTIDFRVE